MMQDQNSVPEDLYYTGEHVWVRKEGDVWCAGITDFAQAQLGEVVYVDLPGEGERFAAGSAFGTVESVKSVNSLFMPLDGTVTEANAELDNSPSLVNADCYGRAWMIRFTAASEEGLEGLLSAAAYQGSLNS